MKDETIIKCDRNKLKDILGISINALKLVEKRDNLEYRLSKCGYELIDKYKVKNKYIYVIQSSTTPISRSNKGHYQPK